MATITFSTWDPTSTILPNPEKGRIHAVSTDTIATNDASGNSSAYSGSTGCRLFLCYLNLSAYRTSNIPSSVLTTLQSRINTLRALGGKYVFQAYYNFSGGGADASLSWMQTHISQLQPIFMANADVIPYVKAGFIGAWAEWHSSTNCYSFGVGTNCPTPSAATAQNARAGVRDALIAATHPLTYIGFRYMLDPSFWYGTALDPSGAYRGKHGRIAWHNDCPCSSDGNSWFNPYGHMSTANQKLYAAAMTDYTPFFGEFSQSCSGYTANCASNLAEMAQYHATGFKTVYSGTPPSASLDAAPFVNAWASGGCFNEMFNKMGYFIQLKTLTHDDTLAPGASFTVTVTLRNIGFARSHFPRRVQFVLRKAGQTPLVFESTSTLRDLPSQDTQDRTFKIPGTIPADAATGVWTVHVRSPDIWPTTKDIAGHAVRFANVDAGGVVWDAANFQLNLPSTVTIGSVAAAPAVEYFGRFDTTTNPPYYQFSWSGSTVKAKFNGTGATATIRNAGGNMNFTYAVDGGTPVVTQIAAGATSTITLASGLSAGNHTVQITRNNESFNGIAEFRGFSFSGGTGLLAPDAYASPVKLEVYGDSITAAMGNMATSCSGYNISQQNAYYGYAMKAMRSMGARPPTLIAVSGIGVHHNGSGATPGSNTMPVRYARRLDQSGSSWDFPSGEAPNVVLIALGTNDKTNDSGGSTPSDATLRDSYVSFAQTLRTRYPTARIVFAVGPINSSYLNAVNLAVSQLQSGGDSNVSSFSFSAQVPPYGCDFHPSEAQHTTMANELVSYLQSLGY